LIEIDEIVLSNISNPGMCVTGALTGLDEIIVRDGTVDRFSQHDKILGRLNPEQPMHAIREMAINKAEPSARS
jgi:hypothetical protein